MLVVRKPFYCSTILFWENSCIYTHSHTYTHTNTNYTNTHRHKTGICSFSGKVCIGRGGNAGTFGLGLLGAMPLAGGLISATTETSAYK